jgi:two-component system sensor histidine kinase EvgS
MSIASLESPPGDILIVDDTPDNLNFLSRVLSEKGYKVRAVTAGAQALVAAQLRPPDLVLLDINMPGMDGFEVCTSLKTDEKLKGIPVIFLSSLTDMQDKLKAFSVGGVDYITKPFQIAEVQARVETHFKLHRFQLALEKNSRNQTANHEAVLNNIADGVLVLDLQGNFLSANAALLRMISKEDLREIIAAPLKKRIKWKQKVFSVTAAPVPGVGTVAVFRDETRRDEIERAKDSMLATASHELRTPLTAVMNYLEMLIVLTRMGRVDTDAFVEHLNRALENSQRLHRLVLAILDQAQIHAGRIAFKKQPFNLSGLFETTRQLLNSLIVQKGLSYELIIHPDVPSEIVGDPDRLQQVLVNLIGNAIKFTAQGGIRVVVHCQDEQTLAISVADTGPGIPAEQLPDIFEAFRRGSDYVHREHQGAGLGLSIVKEIVTRMSGHISVSSEVGVGSVFTVIIPVIAV